MKKYAKPVLYQNNIARVCGMGACGRNHSCGKLVQKF